ncbi:MAG: hypothetical protein Q4B50_02155 [Bacillota bacterium]|nr:hypothetical protein [Bacillota bacterium]
MNRAFVSENDGWGFCQAKRESCIFADEKGLCCLAYCRLYGEEPPKASDEPSRPQQV